MVEPWKPVIVAFVLYAYVDVFNRMMRNPPMDPLDLAYLRVNK